MNELVFNAQNYKSNQKHARKYHSYFLVFRKNQKLTDAVRRNMDGGIHRTESAAAH